jgi:hypothetical protein
MTVLGGRGVAGVVVDGLIAFIGRGSRGHRGGMTVEFEKDKKRPHLGNDAAFGIAWGIGAGLMVWEVAGLQGLLAWVARQREPGP